MSAGKIPSFLSASTFAVIGASTRREKFGNKILRCYLQNGKKAIPINPREEEIEGLPCLANLSSLTSPSETAVSVITPPAVTVGLLEEAAKLGIKHVWLQPGCESPEVIATAERVGLLPTLIFGGPCVLVELGFEGRCH
jgi:predicted CoA-binding protein